MEYFNSSVSNSVSVQKKFMARVYGWMALALTISFASALAVVSVPAVTKFIFMGGFPLIVLCVLEIGIVIFLSAKIRTISIGVASVAFIAYSVINGMTLSSIFLIYRLNSIFSAFLASALMFGAMSVYGIFTKQNLTSAGRYLTMGVIGIVIASLLQVVLGFFMDVTMLDRLISIATVVIFTGLTAYDTQKISRAAAYADSSETCKKAAIIGALELYIDFINIFLALLRMFGKRR